MCVSAGINASLCFCVHTHAYKYMHVQAPVCIHLYVPAAVCAPVYCGRGSRVGAKTAGTSKLFPSFSPQGAAGGPTGRGTLSWDGAGEGRAGGALPAPWQAQLPAHVAFVLLAPSGETEAGASQGHPCRVTVARHSLGIPNPQSAHWSLFPPYLAGVGPSPPTSFAGGWSPWLTVVSGRAPHPTSLGR